MAAPPSLKVGRGVTAAASILAGACLWTFVSAAVAGGSPLRTAGVIAAAAGSLVIAALVSSRQTWIVPALITGVAAILAVVSRAEILTRRPQQGPFDYSNATGAFYLQATAAALMLAVSAPRREARWAGWIAAAAFAGVAFASGSEAATGLLLLPAAALALQAVGAGRAAVIGAAALFAISLLGTIAIGASNGSAPGAGVIDERRKELWHLAVTTVSEHPLTGVGPEGFGQGDALARTDADARRAHHGFLQFGAETGVPGMGLVVLAFAWLLASAGRTDPTAITVLGAAALAAFGIGACLDYFMHVPAIPVAAAALAGTASRYVDA